VVVAKTKKLFCNFLTAMGSMQFVTAFSAGFFAFGFSKVQKLIIR